MTHQYFADVGYHVVGFFLQKLMLYQNDMFLGVDRW
jgi:hypothetical protein